MVGNTSNYKEEDILRTFLHINNKPVSRAELVKNLELGEGTIRTILKNLKEKNLLDSNRPGHFLTTKGKKKKEKILAEIQGPKKLSLKEYKGMKSCGLLIKKQDKTKITLDLRDEAIRSGAYSAIMFKYYEDLEVPFIDIIYKKENPKDYKKIISNFKFYKGNILIVTFAKDYRSCENSALAVMKRMKKIISFP